MIRVTIWNEYFHEKTDEKVKNLYPEGLHGYLKSFIECDDIKVTLASLDMEEQGLPDEVLDNTDVLLWWGHCKHQDVRDDIVQKVKKRVMEGMGFIPLHSAHKSKPFAEILGTTGNLSWGRVQKGIMWNLAPTHPITQGIPSNFEIEEELYTEPFFVPKPDDLIFATWYEDGNIFRGGLTYTRGLGRIFYFHLGHETCTSYKNPTVQKIILNAIRWCAPKSIDSSFNNTNCPEIKEPLFKK